jgi:rifampin ADP-ribosylating transferase
VPIQVDLPCDITQTDETGHVWTFRDEALDPATVVPGAILTTGDADRPVQAIVIDVVPSGDREIVHLEIPEHAPSRVEQETGPFYHGTKADLRPGELLFAGRASNYGAGETANFVYLTATLDAAMWGAELATGEGVGRIYTVEPTGPIEDDPNLTDMRFPGNPTRSYRTRDPLRVTGEVETWEAHPPELVQRMRDGIAAAEARGITAINE